MEWKIYDSALNSHGVRPAVGVVARGRRMTGCDCAVPGHKSRPRRRVGLTVAEITGLSEYFDHGYVQQEARDGPLFRLDQRDRERKEKEREKMDKNLRATRITVTGPKKKKIQSNV
ncbi:hypothetical protein C0Q70_21723 [Pomacea canaliculata]|uniref:Uncharacterized protein n=1 Tax=Pomacea canaliculata TaxID=400727 RepID=A0A2T7NDB2_POMCA|nr:hypothetical protein C0Q70_21723 [Pomacea canaliculata]